MPAVDAPHPYLPSMFWTGAKWELRLAASKSKDLCQVTYCRNLPYYEYRQRKCGLRLTTHTTCSKCRKRRWRANNPDRDAYLNLKNSAKRRNIPFTLTLDEFRELCESSAYIMERGCSSDALHIDRIDPARGYEAGNLQILTCSENVAKGNRERFLSPEVQAYLALLRDDPPEVEVYEEDEVYECPF